MRFMTEKQKYPCPICNSPNQYFEEDHYEICHVCGWVDCAIQREEPDNACGANPISMNEAKRLWHSGEGIYPEYPNNTRRVFIIDGNRFSNLEGFFREIDTLFTRGLDWETGHNYNAVIDLIRGGFGVHEYDEPIKIVWKNFSRSRKMTYGSTAKEIEKKLSKTDPMNWRYDVYKRHLDEIRSGANLAEELVRVIQRADNCILEIIE